MPVKGGMVFRFPSCNVIYLMLLDVFLKLDVCFSALIGEGSPRLQKDDPRKRIHNISYLLFFYLYITHRIRQGITAARRMNVWEECDDDDNVILGVG